jgi:cardiolipin synthase A/B
MSSVRFRWLRTVDESFEAMLTAIEQAKFSVRLEMYIYTASPIGERFRDALARAAGRGVRVRVLLDALGCIRLSEKFWEPLKEKGGQVRWFNPLSLGRCGIRNHRKLLACDEAVAIIGGHNISTEYEGDGVTKGWFDLALQIEGDLAGELASSFDDLYALADFRHRRFARFRKSVGAKTVSTPHGQIVLIGPGYTPRSHKTTLVRDLKAARSLRIIAAYFLPTRSIRQALMKAARGGGRVQIILPAKSDIPLMQIAGHRFYHQLLMSGVELYEYQPQVLHGKLVVADQLVYAGSPNLDRRSFFGNYELLLRISNPELAAEANEIFASTLQHCRKIEPGLWRKSRTVWNKFRERWAYFLFARVDTVIAWRQLRNLR